MKSATVKILPRGSSDADRIVAYSVPEPNSGCWLWMAGLNSDGYGLLHGRIASRQSYEIFKCEIPTAFEIDHLCRIRCCVNPDHLEPVIHAENMARSDTTFHTSIAHCPQGHEYTDQNTYRDKRGHRSCKKCAAIRSAKQDPAKRRAAVNRWAAKNREYLRERARKYNKAKKEGVS